MSRRTRKSGGIHRRGADNRWIGSVSAPGPNGESRRKTVSSAMFCVTLRRFSELHPYAEPPPRRTRADHLEAARLLGTHTPNEWYAYGIKKGWVCEYCGRKCRMSDVTKDHRTPIAHGGSDAIDNLAVACFWCNTFKNDLTEAEFREHADAIGLWSVIARRPRVRRRRRVA